MIHLMNTWPRRMIVGQKGMILLAGRLPDPERDPLRLDRRLDRAGQITFDMIQVYLFAQLVLEAGEGLLGLPHSASLFPE